MTRYYSILLSLGIIGGLVLFAQPLSAHSDLVLQIDALSKQVSETPQDTELLIRRGDLYRRHGDWAAAENDFQSVRELTPDHPMIDWYEGRLLMEAGRSAEAEAMLTRFLEVRNDHAGAYRARAIARQDLNQDLLAAADYQAAIDNSEQPTPSLYRSLVMSLVAIGIDQIEVALIAVDDGLNRFPREVSLLGLGVDLSLAQADAQQASKYMSEIPPLLGNLLQWQFRKAVLICIQGDKETAANSFSAILSDTKNSARQRAGTWHLPVDIVTELAKNPNKKDCAQAAWPNKRLLQTGEAG